jgi:hypothetical protein
MQTGQAGISAGELKGMRVAVRTYLERRVYNEILKYNIRYAEMQKLRRMLTVLWLAVSVLLIGAAVFKDIVDPHPWLLLVVLLPAAALQILRLFPSSPQPCYKEFREGYDTLLAHAKEQLLRKACEGLRTSAVTKDNFPLWGIWGVFGEHRQGVLPEPDVLKDALCCEDGKLRCTPVTLTAFTFEERHCHVFQGAADITIGNVIYDSVREIAYSDIVSVGHHRSTKEFKLSALKPAAIAEMQECGLWGKLQQKAVAGIIAVDDNDFFEIALANGERLHAVFRDVDLMPEQAYGYRYVQSAHCEIEDEAFRPGGTPSMLNVLRALKDRIAAQKEAAASKAGAAQ